MGNNSTILAADLYCGAGGFTTGLLRAAGRLGRPVDVLAINHWKDAINTHSLNHPGVRHLQEDLGVVDPRRAVPGGSLDLLLASPECTSHSFSRGNRPISEQSRATAWHPLRWADQLHVKAMIIENVPAFTLWGPEDGRGRPDPKRRGQTYQKYLEMIEAMGYTLAVKILNAADYGEATTRRRLFIIALKGKSRKIRWPEPTHGPSGQLLPELLPWRGAREIIDPSLEGRSIFNRRRPLARKTLERILIGGERFWPALRPYLVALRQPMGARSLDLPTPTIAAAGTHLGVAEPILINVAHGDTSGRARPSSEPTPTLTGSRELGVAEAIVMSYHGDHQGRVTNRSRPVSDPLATVDCANRFGLVEPFIVVNRTNNKQHSLDDPVPVLNTGGHIGVAEAFLLQQQSGGAARPVSEPVPTVATRGAISLIQPVLTDNSFLVSYFANGKPHSTALPIGTLTGKDRYGFVTAAVTPQEAAELDRTPVGTITPWGIKLDEGLYLDIKFRMLKTHELAAAMGFPPGYRFTGTVSDQVKQIGNAVSVKQAEALCLVTLDR